jgi:heme ABC exporter ATP-binding subunit CcmA
LAGIIEVRGLVRRFGDFEALRGIDLSLPAGSSFALLGPNGAGKTTLVRILSTLLRPTSGTVRIRGHDVLEDPEAVKREVGLVSHNPFLYEELTARENLEFFGDLYGVPVDGEDLLERVGLASRGEDRVETFSHGMRQRLSIARSLLHRPEVLILDEPTQGLDLHGRKAFYALVKGLSAQGKTVFLTTHHLEEAALLCREGAVMDRGRIVSHVNLEEGIGGVEEVFDRLKVTL